MHHLNGLTNMTYINGTIFCNKDKILVKAMAYIITIENISELSSRMQCMTQCGSQCTFSCVAAILLQIMFNEQLLNMH